MTANDIILEYDHKIKRVEDDLANYQKKKQILPDLIKQKQVLEESFKSTKVLDLQLDLKQVKVDLDILTQREMECQAKLKNEADEAKRAAIMAEQSVYLSKIQKGIAILEKTEKLLEQKNAENTQIVNLNREIDRRTKYLNMEKKDVEKEFKDEIARLKKEKESKLINLSAELMDRVHWITAEKKSVLAGIDEAKRIHHLQIDKEMERIKRFENSHERVKNEYDLCMVAIGQKPHFTVEKEKDVKK